MATTKTPNMTDYEAERRNFHLDVPEQFNFATDVVGKWAQDPRKLAMLWIGQTNEVEQITFAQCAERSSRAARYGVRQVLHRVVGVGRALVAHVNLEAVRAWRAAAGPVVRAGRAVVLDHRPRSARRREPEAVERLRAAGASSGEDGRSSGRAGGGGRCQRRAVARGRPEGVGRVRHGFLRPGLS